MIAFARASTVSEGRETESLLLLFRLLELLDVDGLLHLLASSYRGLDEGLTGTKCAHSTGLLKLSLESSQSLLDVFALFYWNYDHNVLLIYFVVILSIAGRVLHTLSNQCAKLLILWRIHKLPLCLPAPPARKSPTLHLAEAP